MKSIVPYTKEIAFDSKIAEICSISLEHELDCGETSIEGNFIVSGEFRSHEVSINKEAFLYKLPFSVDVTDKIVKESVDFEITDFTYEILGDNLLKVNIEFMVTADEIEEEIKEENEMVEEEEREEESQEKEEVREAEIEEIHQMFLEEPQEKETTEEMEDTRLDQQSEELILDTAGTTESEYVTYHIHIVSEEDTLESIVAMYQTDSDTLKRYNGVDTIAVGDKLLIPCLDE